MTAECSEYGEMGFLSGQKAVSHTWPGNRCFLPGQKGRITYVTHYHPFYAPQE